MNAGQQRVILDTTAQGGGIFDGDETLTDVVAESLAILASTGVGANSRLEVDVQQLAVETVSGSIRIEDIAGGLTITDVAGISGVQILAGDASHEIDVRATGSVSVESAVGNIGGGDITLAATSAVNDATLTISANLLASGGAGNIRLASSGHLVVDSGAIVQATNAGQVSLSAGENLFVSSGPQNGNALADIVLADGTEVRSDDGDLLLRATRHVLLSRVDANADGDASLGNITINANFAGVEGGLADTLGEIVDNTADETPNLIGNEVMLLAASGVGSTEDLQLLANSLMVVNSVSGNIRITEVAAGGDNPLVITGISNQLGLIDVHTEDGDLTILGDVTTTVAGNIELQGGDADNDGNGTLTIAARISTEEGLISLESAGSGIVLTSQALVQSLGAGEIHLQSGQTGSGEIFFEDGGVIDAATGNIQLTAFGNITVGQISTGSTSNQAIVLKTPLGVIDGGDTGGTDLRAEAGRLVIEAEHGIGDADALETSVSRLDLINGTTGQIQIQESTGVTLDRITQTATQDVTIVSLGTMSVSAGGSGVDLNGGNLRLSANGEASELVIQQAIRTHGGNAELLADHTVRLGAIAEISTADGDLSLVADNDGGQTGSSGSLLMNAAAKIDAGAGEIHLRAAGEVRVTHVMTSSDLFVTSTHGGITDAGDLSPFDLSATRLVLRSAYGIGSTNPLETLVETLSARNSQSGQIRLQNQTGAVMEVGTFDGVIGIQQLGTGLGGIELSNDASLLVNSSIVSLSGGSITLTADSGVGTADLTINAPLAAAGPQGFITLNAERTLMLNDTGAFVDIRGTTVQGEAGQGIDIADNVIVQSSTGAVIQTIPLLENIVTPQVLATGNAQVLGDFGRLNELNFAITIDWADGTVETFQRLDVTPSSFTYGHQYFGNPNPSNPAAPIPITVSIADDPNIIFLVDGVELTLDPIVSFADVPGEGLAGGIAFDLSVDVPELSAAVAISIDSAENQTDSTVQEQEQTDSVASTEEADISEDRIVKLRVFNAAGEVVEEVDLKGDQALKLLNDFVGFVEDRRLPDGRYQILQQEPGDQMLRVVYDLLLRNGKPADNREGLRDRPPTSDADATQNIPDTSPGDPLEAVRFTQPPASSPGEGNLSQAGSADLELRVLIP